MSTQDPDELAPGPQLDELIAWENRELGFFARLVATLAAAFRPIRSLRGLTHGTQVAPAARFALLTALPFMLLWGIIPLTESLLFGNGEITRKQAQIAVELDVARASAAGALLSVSMWLAWALPFASLLKAFAAAPAAPIARTSAWRLALYRAWLVPCGVTLTGVLAWLLPKDASLAWVVVGDLALQQLPLLLLLAHCQAMARFLGASFFGSMVVAVVPVGVQLAVTLNLATLTGWLLPHLAAQ